MVCAFGFCGVHPVWADQTFHRSQRTMPFLSRARFRCIAALFEIPRLRTIFRRPAMQHMAHKPERLLKKDTTLTVYPYLVSPSAGPDLRLPHREASI